MADRKLTDEQIATFVDRYRNGERSADLARAYEVCVNTIHRHLHHAGVLRAKSKRSKQSQAVSDFTKRARSVIWRQDKTHAMYEKWCDRIKELESKDGGDYTRHEAVVRASKEFNCLRPLFREYDVSLWDPNPVSHPDTAPINPLAAVNVVSDGIEQTHRENLRWAIAGAGRSLRTGEAPKICPNDACYFLYRQALDDPKEFLGKVNQVESKTDADADARASARKSAGKSIAEIRAILESLEDE